MSQMAVTGGKGPRVSLPDHQHLATIRAGRVLANRTLDPATRMGALPQWADTYRDRLSDGGLQRLQLRGVRLLGGVDTGLYDGHVSLPRSRLVPHLTALAEAAVVRESRFATVSPLGPCALMGCGVESFGAVRDPDDLADGLHTLLCMSPPSGEAATAFIPIGAKLPLTALVATMLLSGCRLSREGICTWQMIAPKQFERFCPLDGTPTMAGFDAVNKLCMLEYGEDAVQFLTWALADRDWEQIMGAMYLVGGHRSPRVLGVHDPALFIARFARAFSNYHLHEQCVTTLRVLWGCAQLEQANSDGPLGSRQRSLQLLVEGRLREYRAPETLLHDPWGVEADAPLVALRQQAKDDPEHGNWHNRLCGLIDECRAHVVRDRV